MSEKVVLLPNEVDFNKISISALKKKQGGGGSCKYKYGSHDFVMQLPKMKVPFGLGTPPDQESEDFKTKPVTVHRKGDAYKKYWLEFSLTEKDGTNELKELLLDIDDLNAKFVSDNSNDWWGKHMEVKFVNEAEIYNSMIKLSKKEEYPDRFKAKLPTFEGIPSFKVFMDGSSEELSFCEILHDRVEVDWSWAKGGIDVIPIVECEALWVIQKKVYCTWKIIALQVFSKNKGGYAFRNVEDLPASNVSASVDNALVEDDDLGVEEDFAEAEIDEE